MFTDSSIKNYYMSDMKLSSLMSKLFIRLKLNETFKKHLRFIFYIAVVKELIVPKVTINSSCKNI